MRRSRSDQAPGGQTSRPSPLRFQASYGAAIAYAIMAASWVYLSDRVLLLLFEDTGLRSALYTSKGLVFTAFTTAFIYTLLRTGTRTSAQYESRFGSIFEASRDAIAVLQQDRLVIVNPAFSALFGYALPEDLVGKSFLTLTAAPEPREGSSTTFGGADLYEILGVRRDGSTFDLEITVSTFEENSEEFILALVRDITERKRYEQELISAKEQAEEMTRLKMAFLANMSHEIRTPLSSIIGFADVLREASVSDEYREFAGHIHEGATRLHQTLNSVLDLAKLEQGAVVTNPQVLDLREEVKRVIRLFHYDADKKGLQVRVEVPEEPLLAVLDPGILYRILSNLVSNAIKFTDRGSVLLKVTVVGKQGVFFVRDTGRGISQEFLPHLFDEFRQESSGLARSHEGCGLGLAITARLITLIGGTIEVESQVGHGTIFSVRFPLVRPPEANPVARNRAWPNGQTAAS